MGASVGRSKGFVAEINVTPFVDVMLVLLIIFMVTAPMMTEGLDVQLPRTQATTSLPTDANHVLLTIKKDGVIFLGEYQTPVETLAQQLTATVKDARRTLFLQADKDVPYGIVVEIMGRIRAAGIEQMGIVAERIDDVPGVASVPPAPTAGAASPASPGRGGSR